MPTYRNLTLQCLTEVASIQLGNCYDAEFVEMYNIFMIQLQTILLPNTNIPEAYAHGTSEEQAFIQNLALFSPYFLKFTYEFWNPQKRIYLLYYWVLNMLSTSHMWMILRFSRSVWIIGIPSFWNFFNHTVASAARAANMMGLQVSVMPQRRQLYAEVIVVEDENGDIVRETMKDTDFLVQYKIMRETLIYLSCMDHDDTVKQMLGKLSKQLSGKDCRWNNLNTLFWAIGSISGSMIEEQENRFLVMVICDLLRLCEITTEKITKLLLQVISCML
ncbi:hypothetical protein MtrunA17_Chr8g0340181 [Medicago truncatula]|uniref:Uncharacterized protein n=1 Tax=Medicago truncatula TaxID=3880 RepID=A0A396GBZ6_MEDTR|nr:hypothetical protein MtrunA17_Chr8g0340181 [Medicago truncatula]